MSNHHRQTFAAARAGMPDGQWSRMLIKAAFGVLLASLFGWLLVRRLHDIPFDQTQNALLAVAPAQWLTAAFATVISFWAIGHYDGVIHRYLATGISPLTARLAGAAAIAVGQTLGLGVITGAIVRWRMLPGQNLWQATKFTSLVAVFFLTGWAIVTGSALLLLPGAPFKPLAACGVVALLTLTMLGAVRRRMWAKQWPNLFTITRLVALAAVDTLAAAMAFWVLCPPDLALPLISLLPAFLIAFGAGIVSGSPGGVGAFEITLLALLPQVPEGPLLGAVLAWRVVYFAIPAVIGAAIAIRGPAQNRAPIVPPPRATLIQTATRAETGLIAQGHLSLNAAGHDQAWLTGRTAHCLIGMLDPLISPKSGDNDLDSKKRAVAALIDTAASENRLAVIYKCTARTAVAARGLGLKLHPVAREAWLDPRHFSFDMPSRSGLRRKLRHAEKAGVTLQPGQGCGPGLSQVAAEWAAAHGGERGFSMGRFDPSYLAGQRVFVAYLGARPIAFASFHIGKSEWTLDLMRQTSSVPDGTMHALIVRAIADAKALDLPRLSLSAVPLTALQAAPKTHIAGIFHRVLGGGQTGLAQFKSAFVPNWQTLYMAAAHRRGLLLAGLEIAREIHYPPALHALPQHHHEQYEIASAGWPWHRGDEHDPVCQAEDSDDHRSFV